MNSLKVPSKPRSKSLPRLKSQRTPLKVFIKNRIAGRREGLRFAKAGVVRSSRLQRSPLSQRNESQATLERRRSSPRPISIGQLNALLHLHLRPIKLVVYKRPYPFGGISYLEACFTLRCFQRLSLPHAATQLCPWQNNWCTGGASDPVLSY